MRCVMVTFTVAATVLYAASGYANGEQQISFDNGKRRPGDLGRRARLDQLELPTATTGGALWLKTGSGPPVQYPSMPVN